MLEDKKRVTMLAGHVKSCFHSMLITEIEVRSFRFVQIGPAKLIVPSAGALLLVLFPRVFRA